MTTTSTTPASPVTKQHTVLDSPYGPLTLVATDGVLSALYMTDQRHRPPEETFGVPDPEPFGEVIQQLTEYFAGDRTAFDLPLDLAGTPFQRRVWAELLKIPYGETRTYGELAEELGKPGASRAVGLANGKNPVGIIVPCHRVIGASGSLTGYGGGLDRKQRLLAFESGGTDDGVAGAVLRADRGRAEAGTPRSRAPQPVKISTAVQRARPSMQIPPMRCTVFSGTRFAMNFPASSASAETDIRAAAAPIAVDQVPLLAARLAVVICVRSPHSLMKTAMNAVV